MSSPGMQMGLHMGLYQRQILAPQMILSMEILQVPTQELESLIAEQMAENPVLEFQNEAQEERKEPKESDVERDSRELEHEFERLEGLEAQWREWSPGGNSPGMRDEKDKKLEAMNNTAAPSMSLHEHLIRQVAERELLDDVRELAEYMIYNLDGNGYLPFSIEDMILAFRRYKVGLPAIQDKPPIVEKKRKKKKKRDDDDDLLDDDEDDDDDDDVLIGAPVEQEPEEKRAEELEDHPDLYVSIVENTPAVRFDAPPTEDEVDLGHHSLEAVQSLEPTGVGARDLRECLMLQVGRSENFEFERELLEDHLEDIQKNKLPKIAKETGKTMEEVKDSIAFILSLNPRPGALFTEEETIGVYPDVVVTQDGKDWKVDLVNEYIPRVRVSSKYLEILRKNRKNKEVYDYIKKKVDGAKALIESIEQRQSTLRKISEELVAYQVPFFEKGKEHLRPLKMQDIADRVGVHVSTVSRALRKKYMQTPHGIFAMKFFFTSGTRNVSGKMESIVSVKQRVKEIIDEEDKSKPLSDDEIVAKLRERGVKIARRTVTKYRKNLLIPSSRQRREY